MQRRIRGEKIQARQNTVAGPVSLTLQIGTPFDGSGGMAGSLRKNLNLLKRLDVLVPKPQWYAGKVMELADQLRGSSATEEQLASLWVNPRNGSSGHRTVLCEPGLMATGRELFAKGQFLPKAARRPGRVRRSLGENVQVEFFLSLRNPASLIDAALRHYQTVDLDGLTAGADPFKIRWSEMISRLRENNPETPIVLWMKEEQPYIWPQLLHLAAGLHHPVLTSGVADGAARYLRPEIAAHLEAYLKKYDNYEPDFLARVFEHFTRKYSAPDQAVEVIEVPGWTARTVADLTEAYMEDIRDISRIEGVTFLSA
jgi:hypothetical protein